MKSKADLAADARALIAQAEAKLRALGVDPRKVESRGKPGAKGRH